MKNKIFWLKVCYGWGIIADAIMAILMLSPKLFVRFMGIRLDADTGLGYGLKTGTPLMVGWTVLLIWASRRPVERKDILLITAFPVVAGYILLTVYGLVTGIAAIGQVTPILLSQIGLLVLSTVSYLQAKDVREPTYN